jgi:hypothetical protein
MSRQPNASRGTCDSQDEAAIASATGVLQSAVQRRRYSWAHYNLASLAHKADKRVLTAIFRRTARCELSAFRKRDCSLHPPPIYYICLY